MCALINERILKQLEGGTVPWRRPWSLEGIPTNLIGYPICFWQKNEAAPDGVEQDRPKAFLRYYKVFNVSQCENIPATYLSSERETRDMPSCEAIALGMPNFPKIVHKGRDAFYNVTGDFSNMLKKKNFDSDAAYYSTLFHELVHSTGHSLRLDRKTITEMARFGDESYTVEELTQKQPPVICSHIQHSVRVYG